MNRRVVFIILLPVIALSLQSGGDRERLEILRSQDTLFVQPGDSVLSLSHDLIVSGTEVVTIQDSLIRDYHLESVEGMILLSHPVGQRETFVVSYGHLGNRFAKNMGPVFQSLPVLQDSSPPQEQGMKGSHEMPSEENLPLVADGTIFRGVSISPNSGVSMTGGLQLALQGKLSTDMTVSGSISDQNMPIQPDGNTRTVEELDKVYLEVKHPSATIVAGDIDMTVRNGRFLDFTRRLEGLKVKTWGLDTEVDLYIAGTKGKFHRMEIAGEDGNQGPYSLFSDHGSRDIVVLASSDRVWVDGEMMERGENNDYTIDYSRCEITFTAGQLVGSESRIYVEYEYSDLTYPRQVASTSLSRQFGGGKVLTTASWIRETDNFSTPLAFSLGQEEKHQLEQYGDRRLEIESATVDGAGPYVREPGQENPGDSIFVYIPHGERNGEQDRYRVVFHNVGPDGEYARHVMPDGEVYFEYVEENDRGGYSDLYLPRKTLPSPESHQMLTVSTALDLGDSTRAVINLSGSSLDRNLLSHRDDSDNEGYAGAVELSHNRELSPRLGHLSLAVSSLKRGNLFSPLQRDRRVEFHREWNLPHGGGAETTGKSVAEQLTTVEISHRLGRRSTSSLSFGRYGDPGQRSTRWQGKSALSFHWIPEIHLDLTSVARRSGEDTVNRPSTWQRERLYMGFLPGRFHPFFRYEKEERGKRPRFTETGAGLVKEGDRSEVHLGVTHRTDRDSSGSQQGESWLGELKMNGRWRSGYRIRLLLKQKIKSYALGQDDLNYGLARGNLGYQPRRGNVRANLNFKLEQTLYQEKITVFDSVGSGQGEYRYDQDYDEYFPDPNGNFVVRHMPSGKRVPATRLIAGLRFFHDFKGTGIPYLKETTWRVYGKGEHNGSNLDWDTVFRPSLSSTSINRARLALQHELNYSPSGSRRRVRISSSHRIDVDGQNSRSGMEDRSTKQTISVEEPFLPSITWITDVTSHRNSVTAVVKARQRHSSGWYLSSGPRWKPMGQFEVGTDFSYGRDVGENSYHSFAVQITGVGFHARLLPGKGGRIHASADMYRVAPESPVSVALPPESAQGLKPGNTFRCSVTALLVFGENISANTNLTYFLDPIHDGIFTATGEIRASF